MKVGKLLSLLREIRVYDEEDPHIKIYSDYKGYVSSSFWGDFNFYNEQELFDLLKSLAEKAVSEKPIIKVDGVEYSESTVRSIIKKHTK